MPMILDIYKSFWKNTSTHTAVICPTYTVHKEMGKEGGGFA
jgi:hypothetical protein